MDHNFVNNVATLTNEIILTKLESKAAEAVYNIY